jgi:hypothetical protein
MLDAQAAEVAEVFVEAGCELRATLSRDGWSALVLDRAHPEQIADELDEEWFADTPWADDAAWD